MDRAGTVVHNLSLYPVPRALPLAVALLLALPAAAHPAPAPTPEPLLVGAATDHYPYSYLDGNNRITGFAVDLFDEVARVGGLNIKRILGSSADLNRRFFAGEFPVAQVYTFVPGGQGETIFSAPYLTLKGALFVRRDRSRPIASLADLAGRSVIVGRGSSGESFLRRSGIPVWWYGTGLPRPVYTFPAIVKRTLRAPLSFPISLIIRSNRTRPASAAQTHERRKQ